MNGCAGTTRIGEAAGDLEPQEAAPRPRVLVVAADPAIRRRFSQYLEEQGLTVAVAAGPGPVSRLLKAARYSLLVLDLRRGEQDDLDLLREVRAHSDIPVVATTGHQGGETDRVAGLELGADDYLTGPFSLRELLARIHAVLRRVKKPLRPSSHRMIARHSRFGGWILDAHQRRLVDPAGRLVSLTRREHALLVTFIEAAQRCLTREFLLDAMRVHEDISDRSIDVLVLRLRRKLERDPAAPSLILTERGIGYIFALPVVRTVA